MLAKISLAAAIVACSAVLASVDLRELYDEMYPVSMLKRDAFGICRQADPAFVRARQSDRDECYDSMPHDFALAIGWVGPRSPLANQSIYPGGYPPAEMLLAGFARLPEIGAAGPRQFPGVGHLPAVDASACDEAPRSFAHPAGLPQPVAASHAGFAPLPRREPPPGYDRTQDTALAAFGLAPRGAHRGTEKPLPLPPLTWSAAGAFGDSSEAGGAQSSTSLLDAMPSADLGDPLSFPMASPAAFPAASGCRSPA
jgi:hypothetical protein